MRAAHIVGPRRVQVHHAPDPVVRDGEVLVRNHRLSVCGSDLRKFDRALPEEKYPLPDAHPCHECAGVIEESRSERYRAGQRVIVLPFNSTGLGEYVSVPASRIIPLPDGGDLSVWLMCQHMGTVMYSCGRIGSVIGKDVVVLGQGPIGLNFTYWMARMGARRVIVADLWDYRLEMARKLGATHTVNASSQDVQAAVEEATGGKLADVAVEAAGEPETANLMFSVLRPQGLAVIFGEPHMQDVFPINYDLVQSRMATVISTLSARTEDPAQCIKECVEMVAQGRLDLSHLVTHRMPFGDVQRAFDMYSEKSDFILKAVLEL